MKSKKDEKLLSSIFNVGRLVREELCKGKRPADFTQVEIEVLKFVGNNGSTTMKSVAVMMSIPACVRSGMSIVRAPAICNSNIV